MLTLTVLQGQTSRLQFEQPNVSLSADQAVTVEVAVTEADAATVSMQEPEEAALSVAESVRGGDYPDYTGDYEITPTDTPQALNTAARVLTGNIIVHPIPQNYGRILWNGSTLTVY